MLNKEELARVLVIENFNLTNSDNVKVVWFCKTLKNWKAMVADISPNGHFYEVTYNGEKNETYVDDYVKIENKVIKGNS